jgi:CHAT domain-containing protein
MASLPPEVTRLIIAADGALHHLPFESLRATPASPPLGSKYEIVHVPSATLWRHWRTSARVTSAGRVLTLADPSIDGSADRFGRLPHAREESRAIERAVSGSRALVGAAASEHALKTTDPATYDVLHFAAHAVADQTHPERSAVLLASGDRKEDGLLQAREIEGLGLDGRIVVLSACQTASGAVQSGEGVLSLARAFFEAGAHAVVGSRWPLRDADAAVLFDTFYRQLAGGRSLAEALKLTQDEARAAGRPAAVWAGLVLLGNGDLRPLPVVQPRGFSGGRYLAPAIAAALFVVLAVIARRRRPLASSR